MTRSHLFLLVALIGMVSCSRPAAAADGDVARRTIRTENTGRNLLGSEAWRPWRQGFQRDGEEWVCDNGLDTRVQRGASQTIELKQTRPEPIVARAWSRATDVSGSADSNYSVYLDLVYMDGSHLWGQTSAFATGTHDWQQRQVVVFPETPVRQVTMHMLLRGHSGKASFRRPELFELRTPHGAARFDGVPVVMQGDAVECFQVRDVATNSDFVRIEKAALGLRLAAKRTRRDECDFYDVTLSDTTGSDRAVTLVFSTPVESAGLSWFEDPRRSELVAAGREYACTSRFSRVGSNGKLSRYPFGCVGAEEQGVALGIDMSSPAFYRVGYNASTGELFLAYDIGLAPEQPHARVRFCTYRFEARHGFRGALARYYQLYPNAFRCRTPEQGLWMPFAKISEVGGYGDFGFKFKEGDNETAWDDGQGIVTFRYTEPMTWWMRLPDDVPRTYDAALEHARQLARDKRDKRALALSTSGYHDEAGHFVARMLDTPWCNGAVWSMNSMPALPGTPTDFMLKWNADLKDRLYGPDRKAELDGEYIDSSEGYVTSELDFARHHFSASTTPLCFDATSHRPAIFRGLIAQAYVRKIAEDVHAMERLMMANSTPIRLCWLAPYLDVLGTETDWNPEGDWRPMSDADLLYRRVMCKGKPYCILMNTRFEEFSHELVERYMRRSLAYGMFPGFFSHNASQGHYFQRPELYNRDRPLFRKYVPLCKLVAEAGWEPITRANSDDTQVYVERFGERTYTVFNDRNESRAITIQLVDQRPQAINELVGDRVVPVQDGRITLELGPGEVAVLVVPE